MNLRRRGVSSVFGLGAACAMLSGCLVQVIPVAQGDAAVNDASPDVTPVADASPAPDARPAPDVMPAPDATPTPTGGEGSVDLLVVVDDSNSMTRGQGYLNSHIGEIVGVLLQRHGVRDVRVGVVTTDLGTAGIPIPSCEGARGDDARLNPRIHGPATSARPTTLPSDTAFCGGLEMDPFVTVSAGEDAMAQLWKPACHTRIGVGGCGLEQPLEAARRALVVHGAAGGYNAGFLRPNAALAILVLSDEEDGSVRDCRDHDGVGGCDDATDVYSAMSSRWSSPDLNLRFYTYAPGGAQDPTWPLERYVDPSRPERGLLSLKPGHPERVLFAAISGVPVSVPQTADGRTDWNGLLGAPAAGRPDDFNARNADTAFTDATNPAGATSMRQRDPDPVCVTRLLPACRAPGSTPSSTCNVADQPFAWRARRLAEVARRFDESRLCNGASCGNGMVASICGEDGAPFMRFADMIARRVVR